MGGGKLLDYKYFCFNGTPEFLYVIADREKGKAALAVYDTKFNRLPVTRKDEEPLIRDIPRPDNWEEMLRVARILSEDFPHVRVDLYNIQGNIIFGELTFYDGSGYFKYEPDEFDYTVGNYFCL